MVNLALAAGWDCALQQDVGVVFFLCFYLPFTAPFLSCGIYYKIESSAILNLPVLGTRLYKLNEILHLKKISYLSKITGSF